MKELGEALAESIGNINGSKKPQEFGVPYYHIDPDGTDLLIQELNGESAKGYFKNGEFVVIEQLTQWSCDERGCGTVGVKKGKFEYYRHTDHHGNLIESKTQDILVSNCCGGDVSLWDFRTDDTVAGVTGSSFFPDPT